MPTIQLESILNYRYLAYGGGDHGEARTKTNMMKRYQKAYLEEMEVPTMAEAENPSPSMVTMAQRVRIVTNEVIKTVHHHKPMLGWRKPNEILEPKQNKIPG